MNCSVMLLIVGRTNALVRLQSTREMKFVLHTTCVVLVWRELPLRLEMLLYCFYVAAVVLQYSWYFVLALCCISMSVVYVLVVCYT